MFETRISCYSNQAGISDSRFPRFGIVTIREGYSVLSDIGLAVKALFTTELRIVSLPELTLCSASFYRKSSLFAPPMSVVCRNLWLSHCTVTWNVKVVSESM